MPSIYRNISFATAASVGVVMREGKDVTVRGSPTKEVLNRVTVLERPIERFVFLPQRLNNVFAQIAETMWVLKGRNDIGWLRDYLPRAEDYSDDGAIWRAGYGPRLRQWHGAVDQLDEVRKLLLEDPLSRRAVMSLYDPEADFVDSKDIPCNNWLSWIIRDGSLHFNVAVRSNDAMWGFSGVNAFEWSVLHEMMAHWTNTSVGSATYFATSFHLYEKHHERANKIVDHFHGLTPYDFGIKSVAFSTPWKQFEEALAGWFTAEERIRHDPEAPLVTNLATRDPFFANGLNLIRLKWASASWTDETLSKALAALPENDLTAAAYEHFGRSKRALLANIHQPNIAQFFAACGHRAETIAPSLKKAIKALHSRKNSGYGGSWKKRGERISILPNIARKIDRLQVFIEKGLVLSDETILDTALDLYVYVAKYRLFLAEQERDQTLLPSDAPMPFSDHDGNFNRLIDGANFERAHEDLGISIQKAVDSFEKLWPTVDQGASVGVRQEYAAELCLAAESIVAALALRERNLVTTFIQSELGLGVT